MLCGLTILGVSAELIPPKLQQYMVDHILSAPAAGSSAVGEAAGPAPDFRTALLVVVLALAGSRVLLSVVGVLKGQLATAIGAGLTSGLRLQMVEKLQSLAVAYYDRHQIGSMMSRVAHDSEVLHGLMHQLTGGFLLQTVQLFGVGAMLVGLNPKLAMYTLIPVPLVFFGSWIFWRKVYPRYYRLWDASSKQMSSLNGMLSGIRVVKAFAQEDREFDRFKTASDHLRQWRLWVEKTNAWYSAAMGLVFSLGGLIVWYAGGRDVIGQQMTLGELIAFLAYLAMFYAPLNGLTSFTSWLTSFLSGSQRVLELLDTPAAIMEPESPRPWKSPAGAIAFDNVTFGYDRNQPVLKDISFRVAPGEMVGIVGRSGSGKTTMVNLLGRFYDVQEGRILIDGIDVRDISMHELRQRMGIVFQDSFLFRGTIWKNLAYGRPKATIEEGLAAAKAAGAHDFICRQQLGYETLLGERGAGLSGGEKQRLSIARTLLYDPKILVLDEATSNIDAEAEKSIQEALQVLIRGRTTIAIAHRLSTLRNADRILVFDRGTLIEEGSHAELLERDGAYARLVRIQTQVSKDPSVDRILQAVESVPQAARAAASDGASVSRGESAVAVLEADDPGNGQAAAADQPPAAQLRWLDPAACEFRRGPLGQLEAWEDGTCLSSNAYAVCTFPASHPRGYVSVRGWCDEGEERELGMIRALDEFPEASAALVEESLQRRYLLRVIERVVRADLRHGYLDLEFVAQDGPGRLTMRWTQSQAVDFGEDGKLLIDAEENRYVVPSVEQLPPADRERFLQFIYW
jgi:ATP-binding cassette subfamily B protein